MCGINGIFAYRASAEAPSERELLATRDHMAVRGPDGFGEWWNGSRRLGLGHRRLSIIDLSDRANQPMLSDDEQLSIVFNGEIYNHQELRANLEAQGRRFRTTSDTEVLLQLYAAEGEAMVHRLRGMFAFAIWDVKRNSLFLARDPYGIKPLYTSDVDGSFRFASQVKALLAGGGLSRTPDPAGVVGFHLWGSVPEPFTLYRDIAALPAGHTQIVDNGGAREPKPYISVAQVLADGAQRPCALADVGARIKSAALDSVQAHLVSDVEVGVFLSAGVDSGALLGLMRDAGQAKIRAVTLGFEEFRNSSEDEVPLASQVASYYGADHIIRTISQSEFSSDMAPMLEHMDQPSIDGVNTWFVSKATRELGIKVALSGVGGDEVLAGYPSFREIPTWVTWLRAPAALPGAGRGARMLLAALGLGARSPKLLGMLEYGGSYPGAYMLRRSLFLPFELSTVLDPDLVTEGLARLNPLGRLAASMSPAPASPISRVSALESTNYMRHQLLRDADWAGMAHSLEIRTPFVDIDFLRALAPVVPHLRAQRGKRALASAPNRSLPDVITQRPKTGFGVPTGRWLSDTSPHSASTKGLASRAWALEVFAKSQ